MKSELYQKLFFELKKIPSLSKKQISKIIEYFLECSESNILDLNSLILNFKRSTKKCSICNYLNNQDICYICSDNTRDKKLMVVEQSADIDKFEELKIYKGKYFVFDTFYDLKENNDHFFKLIDELKKLCKSYNEIILAFNLSIIGRLTMEMIKKILYKDFKNLEIYQLSSGLPLNGSVEYADPTTLKESLDNKINLKRNSNEK
ncbi:toprim domain-containing protein [Metamycoplasma orale]|uniref:Recombination protein RecR n=1 Tax=Metamycoplasma orale TaxID=2121 RepID=A0A448ZVM9_METOS|nr:toprim domain-containing protein [Metamycoplasma orale]VEU55322.1 recombination protein RecR [Metamycoplasma orale]